MKRNELFKPILILFLAVLLIQIASGIALFAAKLGVAPDAIREFYLGSEEKFTRPRTMPGLLEVTVPHLAAIGVTLFILWHFLSIFAPLRPATRAALPLLCFACVAGDLASGYLIRYVHPGFVYFKMAAFAVFELSFLSIIAILLANITIEPLSHRREAEALLLFQGSCGPHVAGTVKKSEKREMDKP